MSHPLFLDDGGAPRRLLGCSINSGAPRLVELAARLGFDTVWIELEHGSFDLRSAEAACLACELGGALPLVRTAGTAREMLLQGMEIGGRILVVPMVNDAATAAQVARYTRFPPAGQRGYNTRSRAARFGIDKPAEMMARLDAQTAVFPQIETREAVKNLDAILAVEGLDGIFVGPGDLSADLGRPGDFADATLRETVVDCVRRARAAGRHAGILAAPGPLMDEAREAGADLCVCASDMGPLIAAWKKTLAAARGMA